MVRAWPDGNSRASLLRRAEPRGHSRPRVTTTASAMRNRRSSAPPPISGSCGKPMVPPSSWSPSEARAISPCQVITMASATRKSPFTGPRRLSGSSRSRTERPRPSPLSEARATPRAGRLRRSGPHGSGRLPALDRSMVRAGAERKDRDLRHFRRQGRLPVPGDYDGVGHTEAAVYRPSTAQWFVQEPGGKTETLTTFGWANLHDLPVETSIESLVQLGVVSSGVQASSLTPSVAASIIPLVSLPTISPAPSLVPSILALGDPKTAVSSRRQVPSGPLALSINSFQCPSAPQRSHGSVVSNVTPTFREPSKVRERVKRRSDSDFSCTTARRSRSGLREISRTNRGGPLVASISGASPPE